MRNTCTISCTPPPGSEAEPAHLSRGDWSPIYRGSSPCPRDLAAIRIQAFDGPIENDDQTAERQSEFFREAGINPADVVPWNAYPWYINAAPTKAQLAQGTEPLRQLIALLPTCGS